MAQVVSVTSAGQTKNYNTLSEAVVEVNKLSTTPTLTMLADQEDLMQTIVFSASAVLDLNGHKVTACEPEALMEVSDSGTVLTIKDSGKGGMLLHYDGVDTYNTDVYGITVKGGATLNLQGGTMMMSSRIDDEGYIYYSDYTEKLTGVSVGTGSTLNIAGGEIILDAKTKAYGVAASGTVNMSSGKIDGGALGQIYACYLGSTAARLNMTGGEITARRQVLIPSEEEQYYNSYRVGVYVGSGVAVIDGGKINATSRWKGYAVYGERSSDITLNGGAFKTVNIMNNNYNVYTTGKFVINGGAFNNHYFLEKYTKGNYINAILPDDSRFKEGYYCYVSGKKDDNGVVKNLTRKVSYETLEAAVAGAVNGDTLSLLKDYTLTQSLSIPKDVMLLLPCDEQNSCFTTQAEGVYPCSLEPKPYHTLTLADNVTLTVDGEMSLSARLHAEEGGEVKGCGAAMDAYGAVKLGKNAKIDVNGSLYCWGFIHGDGTVTVNNGGKLYEVLDMLDWRGGSRTSEFYNKMYPIMQYQVQNVESKLVLMPGAQSLAGTAMEVQHMIYYLRPVPFVGPKDAFFTTGRTTTVTRQYDPVKDRMTYDFGGDITMGGMFLDFGEGLEINSKDYRAHLVDNWTLNQNSGTLTFPYKYNMLPGTQINIAEGAKMVIAKNGSLNMIDKDEWGMYTFVGYLNPAYYTVANGVDNKSVRCGANNGQKSEVTLERMTDAIIDVRGILQIDGYLTATKGGANIVSSIPSGDKKMALVVYNNDVKQKDDCIYFVKLQEFKAEPCTIYPAPLKNADGSNVMTNDSKAGTRYVYAAGQWKLGGVAGDVNNDGQVNIDDVSCVISVICGDASYQSVSDVNNDGVVNVDDVSAVIGIICGQ